MARLVALILGAAAACAQAGAVGADEVLARDDECAAGEPGGCSLSALQLRARAPGGPDEEGTFLPEVNPTRTCGQVLANIDRNRGWDLTFFNMNLNVGDADAITYSAYSYRDDEQAKRLFYDHNVKNIQVSKVHMDNACSEGGRMVLWFYPTDDHNGAFDLNNFVCSRMSVATRTSGATCVNLYRVSSVKQISMVLERFVFDHTVIHAVIGGHGSNDEKGVLGLGSGDLGDMAQDAPTSQMLRKLEQALVPGATVFLDSCYSATNGIAKYVSKLLPGAWVFGGIVSLDSSIDMVPGRNGPPRVVSDFPSADDDVPSFKGGDQAIDVFRNGVDLGSASKFGAPATDPDPDAE